MKRALILTCTGFRDHEVIYPYYRLKGAGFEVDVVADKHDERRRVYGISNCHMPTDILYSTFTLEWKKYLDTYDFLVIPGGVVALEKLRLIKSVISFVSEWNAQGKVIASICQGAQVLISAKVVKGRTISGYYNLEDDINNAGATYSRDPVAVDANIVSCPHYDYMGEWMETALYKYKEING